MERKYYFRGLGVGIVVTALIMGIVASRNKTMTDQEIIARAKELGMVENTVLSDPDEEKQERADLLEDVTKTISKQDAEDSNMEEAPVREIDQNMEREEEEQPEDTHTEDEESGETESAEDLETEDENPEENTADEEVEDTESVRDNATSAAVKTITINSGDGSHTVARKLADVGVVTSADTFDEFLCQNGYDKKLRTGTFSIPVDASDEQIARIVTGLE